MRRPCTRGSPSGYRQGVVYTTFHYPVTGANVVTTEHSDWATNCPEYKVTAVQVTPAPTSKPLITHSVPLESTLVEAGTRPGGARAGVRPSA